MIAPTHPKNRRILIVDDNPAIHNDFRKIFESQTQDNEYLESMEQLMRGESSTPREPQIEFQPDFATQGQEAMVKVAAAIRNGSPYAVAFVDCRMPPGWDGVETIHRLWQVDQQLQTVLCTAYSDYSLQQIQEELGNHDRLIVLKKPFENGEVLQLANTLSEKWNLAEVAHGRSSTPAPKSKSSSETDSKLQTLEHTIEALKANQATLLNLIENIRTITANTLSEDKQAEVEKLIAEAAESIRES